MTHNEFARRAQMIYEKYHGSAGEEGHMEADSLMKEALIGLGYQEGIEILDSMSDYWYA